MNIFLHKFLVLDNIIQENTTTWKEWKALKKHTESLVTFLLDLESLKKKLRLNLYQKINTAILNNLNIKHLKKSIWFKLRQREEMVFSTGVSRKDLGINLTFPKKGIR